MNTPEPLGLSDGSAVVTGAASGIGRALVQRLAASGTAIAISDIDEAALAEFTAELIASGARVLPRVVDIADYSQVDAFAAEAVEWAQGTLRLVFANAGIHGLTPAIGGDLNVWERVIDINLKGAVHSANAFVPRLMDANIPAQFVLTASGASYIAVPGMAPYIATKHAVWGLAEALRAELRQAGSNVGITIAAPGRTASAILKPQIEAARRAGGEPAAKAYTALLAEPDHVAAAMLEAARRREFWIIPSREPVESYVRARFDELLDALPMGRSALEARS